MRLFIITLFASSSLAAGASAQPAAAPSAQDARCLLDMVALSNASEPEAQRAGQAGVVFFAGRISAHDPSFAFARLTTMAASLNPQTAQAELQQTCGPMVQRYMQQVETALGPPSQPPSTPPGAH